MGEAAGIDVEVLIVGAGITGIYQLYRAREEGFSVRLLDAAPGVGGCWYWNKYPGCRFDSESYTYGYLFSEELFDEWEWSEHFASQPEIERYLNHTIDKFDLRRDMQFDTRVTAAVFDDATSTWTVTTDRGDTLRCHHLVAATGVLSVPYVPDIDGRETFAGIQHHTGLWPAEPVDFRGKRVAIVGTSSSGVQVLPTILADVASVTVYQRTANWCTPLNNRPITAEEQAELRAGFEQLRETLATSRSGFAHPVNEKMADDDTPEARQAFYEQLWNSPGFMKLTYNYQDMLFNDAANQEWCDFIAGKIRSIVQDPATAEKLIPTDHGFGGKRPPFVIGYFEAFNDPKVSLVDLRDTPMVRVTEAGIETTDGVREFDIIVWATGFDFGTGALSRMGVVGRDGLTLNEHWADGPSTFAGLQTHGFPNFFFPGGPHAAAGNNPRYNGDQVDFVMEVLCAARERGADVVETTEQAEERWTRMVDKGAEATGFGALGQYVGSNIPGKANRYLLNAGGRAMLFKVFADCREHGYAEFGI
ncbi:MAG: NAD(P)/FAD-dependent oxidoreductase [Acidimicrobiia bacterium]